MGGPSLTEHAARELASAAAKSRATAASAKDKPPRLAKAPLAHRVLICEDDKDIAELLAAALQMRAREVLVCHDGSEAVAQVEKWRPAAAIIDIGLPGVTGYGVAQHLRALPFGHQVLLIAITGYDSPADVEMARYAGFNWHFAKPARPSLLLEVLDNPGRAPKGKRDGTPLDR
jgi:CheY-like chemotaxis protein